MSGALPPGPGLPPLLQAWRYTFAFPAFAADARARYGASWTLRLPGFPPSVVTTDRDAIERLFSGPPLGRRHANDMLEPLLGPRSLLLLEPAEHLQRRKLEAGAFHGSRLRGYAARIGELADAEVASWPDGTVVDVHPRARALTLQVVLELVLGIDDLATRERLALLFDALDRPQNNLGMFLPAALVRRSRWNLASRPFWSVMDQIHALVSARIASSRRDDALTGRRDVLASLMLARDEGGRHLTDDELRDEMVTLVAAGHETTATAIAWGLDLLAHHPSVLARLKAELDGGEPRVPRRDRQGDPAPPDRRAAHRGAPADRALRHRPPRRRSPGGHPGRCRRPAP